MIDELPSETACERFQTVAWNWLQSGEITRTAHMLSPLEELAGFNFGFVYLLAVPGVMEQLVYKIGFSEHPMRRIRELQPQYRGRLSLRACFVGDQPAERFAHRRFASLRVKNELFYAHPIIEEYFKTSREQMRERIRSVHVCTSGCPQLRPRMDLRMLGSWLSR
ncbi:MAG TPA: GIY-YIG nuclease family protein [Candidatus Baltobacteraceae bacterium]|nr:GIY-YIG nuclease family protein [Candidatus Baltobacteraceae bacterium]